jgi:hypothetical protein
MSQLPYPLFPHTDRSTSRPNITNGIAIAAHVDTLACRLKSHSYDKRVGTEQIRLGLEIDGHNLGNATCPGKHDYASEETPKLT